MFANKFTAALVVCAAVSAANAGLIRRLADNPVDACNGSNNYGPGHSCAFKTGDGGQAEGVCEAGSDGVLTCQTNAARELTRRLADNPVDACNGSNHYGPGHSCAFSTSDGSTAEGTCQTDSSNVLVCQTNAARSLTRRLADNPVDACNGSNNYGPGHSCAFKTGDGGQAEGVCEAGSDGVLTCQTNAARELTRRIAPNPVDACNGSNHYGPGHSCQFTTSDGSVSQGTCENDNSGVLTCMTNVARELTRRLADNPVDACNGSNHYGPGHSCAFSTSDGSTAEGTCETDSDNVLVCETN